MKNFKMLTILFAVLISATSGARAEQMDCLAAAIATKIVATAEQKMTYEVENGTLLAVKSSKERLAVDVPDKLDGNFAYALLTGKVKEVTLEDKVGKSVFSIDFPFVNKTTTYADTIVSYRGGTFVPTPVNRVSVDTDWGHSILGLWTSALFILFTGIANVLLGNPRKALGVFCAAMFLSLAIVASITAQTGYGVLAVLASIVAMIISACAGAYAANFWGSIFGTFAAFLAATFISLSVCTQGYKIAVGYSTFLLLVCVTSFIIASLVDFVQERLELAASRRITG